MIIQNRIETKLKEALEPTHLEVVNESSKHNVPPDSETHFKVIVTSGAFEGMGSLQRHQRVYGLLGQELEDGVHALSIKAFSPEEWSQEPAVGVSPPCLGGSKAG